jgi:hypothetical protein
MGHQKWCLIYLLSRAVRPVKDAFPLSRRRHVSDMLPASRRNGMLGQIHHRYSEWEEAYDRKNAAQLAYDRAVQAGRPEDEIAGAKRALDEAQAAYDALVREIGEDA